STYYYLCLVVLYLSHPAPSSHIYTLSLHDALPICIYKSFRMIYRNIGQNAVPEIDDITVFPKFIYHLLDHFLNGFWRRKQTRGVEIALKRNVSPAEFPGVLGRAGPIYAQGRSSGTGHLMQGKPTTFGEDNHRHFIFQGIN